VFCISEDIGALVEGSVREQKELSGNGIDLRSIDVSKLGVLPAVDYTTDVLVKRTGRHRETIMKYRDRINNHDRGNEDNGNLINGAAFIQYLIQTRNYNLLLRIGFKEQDLRELLRRNYQPKEETLHFFNQIMENLTDINGAALYIPYYSPMEYFFGIKEDTIKSFIKNKKKLVEIITMDGHKLVSLIDLVIHLDSLGKKKELRRFLRVIDSKKYCKSYFQLGADKLRFIYHKKKKAPRGEYQIKVGRINQKLRSLGCRNAYADNCGYAGRIFGMRTNCITHAISRNRNDITCKTDDGRISPKIIDLVPYFGWTYNKEALDSIEQRLDIIIDSGKHLSPKEAFRVLSQKDSLEDVVKYREEMSEIANLLKKLGLIDAYIVSLRAFQSNVKLPYHVITALLSRNKSQLGIKEGYDPFMKVKYIDMVRLLAQDRRENALAEIKSTLANVLRLNKEKDLESVDDLLTNPETAPLLNMYHSWLGEINKLLKYLGMQDFYFQSEKTAASVFGVPNHVIYKRVSRRKDEIDARKHDSVHYSNEISLHDLVKIFDREKNFQAISRIYNILVEIKGIKEKKGHQGFGELESDSRFKKLLHISKTKHPRVLRISKNLGLDGYYCPSVKYAARLFGVDPKSISSLIRRNRDAIRTKPKIGSGLPQVSLADILNVYVKRGHNERFGLLYKKLGQVKWAVDNRDNPIYRDAIINISKEPVAGYALGYKVRDELSGMVDSLGMREFSILAVHAAKLFGVKAGALYKMLPSAREGTPAGDDNVPLELRLNHLVKSLEKDGDTDAALSIFQVLLRLKEIKERKNYSCFDDLHSDDEVKKMLYPSGTKYLEIITLIQDLGLDEYYFPSARYASQSIGVHEGTMRGMAKRHRNHLPIKPGGSGRQIQFKIMDLAKLYEQSGIKRRLEIMHSNLVNIETLVAMCSSDRRAFLEKDIPPYMSHIIEYVMASRATS